ncbi:MAG: ABC transporter substrate-binding protein [Desulfopila sp.]
MKGKLIPWLIVTTLFFALPGHGREITDMSGRKVTVPENITKVFGITPPATYLLYAVDPTVICGLNFSLWESEKKYTIPQYRELPVIGGLVGQSRNLNREVLLQVNPDFLLYWVWNNSAANAKFEASVAGLNFPMVSVQLNSIQDYPDALEFMGDVLGKKKRGQLLSQYARETLHQAEEFTRRLGNGEKIRVYYAEGPDGLQTERSKSLHAELIPLAGGVNVHQGEEADRYGMEKVSMEQVLLYDPEVILVREKSFFTRVYDNPRWQNVRAVRNRQVYLIPYIPFNWFDRPPSYMRLLGIKWLMHTLHPKLYAVDMVEETKRFYHLFLGVELNDQEAREVLYP